MATDQTAPGELELVREFVNSLDLETGVDELSGARPLAEWLAERDLIPARTRLSGADLRRAVELREALRGLLLANNGVPPRPADVEILDRATASAELAVRLRGQGETVLEPRGSGLDAAIGRLAAIVFEATVNGTWERLKACPADDCHWAFYDHSRNRSGTWCTMAVCGNRSKVRAYRQRATTARRRTRSGARRVNDYSSQRVMTSSRPPAGPLNESKPRLR
jgi:predicted RNA-binding Zn ribbon-like protein